MLDIHIDYLTGDNTCRTDDVDNDDESDECYEMAGIVHPPPLDAPSASKLRRQRRTRTIRMKQARGIIHYMVGCSI